MTTAKSLPTDALLWVVYVLFVREHNYKQYITSDIMIIAIMYK